MKRIMPQIDLDQSGQMRIALEEELGEGTPGTGILLPRKARFAFRPAPRRGAASPHRVEGRPIPAVEGRPWV